MAYSLGVIESGPLFLGRLFDTATVDDMTSLFAAIIHQRPQLRGVKIFCDVDDAQPGTSSFKEINAAVDFLRTRSDAFAGMKWANYCTGVLNFGISRMAGELANGLPFEYRVFQDRRLAFNWLGVSPVVVAQVDAKCQAGV